MHVTLRPVAPDDQAFLFRNYAATRDDELAVMGLAGAQREFFLKMQFNAQHQSYAVQHPQAEHHIILLDEQPAGRIIVGRTGEAILLIDISLLPEYRRAGIGSALIKELLIEAAAKNLPVRLHVLKTNVRAAHLYERLGFSVQEDDGVYLRMQFVHA